LHHDVDKAKMIDSMVTQFGAAASGEVGLVVKSAGAIELGLGVFGKLSVGDNNLLSELAKGMATEVVSRLTVLYASQVLSAIDFQKQPLLAQALRSAQTARQGKFDLNTARSRVLLSPFLSADARPV
jgi:hypothetical protein